MHDNTEALCQAWLDAKRAEEKARRDRLAVEAQMVEAFEVPTEGSKTTQLDNFKITMTQPVTRKLDEKAWANVKGKVSTDLHPIKVKVEADSTGCKWLIQNEPQAWALIASAFETRPGKIGVKVEAK